MLPYNAHKNSQGFTMIETLATVIIMGILSAIAAPSFLALFKKSEVNNAVSQVQGALQEAQRQAIRRSKSCTVILDGTNNKVTGTCLVTGDRTLPDGVAMANNIPGANEIIFGIQGNTVFDVDSSVGSTETNKMTGKIVVYEPGISNVNMKCVAISKGIGIIRSGTYSGPTSPVVNITDSGICNASH